MRANARWVTIDGKLMVSITGDNVPGMLLDPRTAQGLMYALELLMMAAPPE